MKSVVFITNIPAHYRTALMNKAYGKLYSNNIELSVIFSRLTYNRRRYWNIQPDKFLFKYIVLPKCNSMEFKYKLFEIGFSIGKYLNEIKPELVILTAYSLLSVLAAKHCKKNNIPYLVYSGETLNSSSKSRFRRIIRKWILSYASGALVYGNSAKKYLELFTDKNFPIYTVINSIDTESFIKRIDEKKTNRYNNDVRIKFLYVGEIREYKGVQYFLQALYNINSIYLNKYSIEIVGDGDYLEELKLLAKKLEIANINFHGKVNYDKIDDYFVRSDVFVFPSLVDNFGLVLNEAACAGLPLLGSKYSGGSNELIEEFKNGFIIDPKDIPEFTKRLEYFLKNPADIKTFGNYSRKIINERVNIEMASEGFCNAVYSTLL